MKKILAILMAAVFCACSMFGCAQKKQVTIEKAEDLNGLKVGVQGGTTGESFDRYHSSPAIVGLCYSCCYRSS